MSLAADDERTVLTAGSGSGLGPAEPGPARAGGANALPVGTRLGEFEITGLLGEGGFGIVYLACDRSLERNVALKEYMPAAFATRGAGVQVTMKSRDHADTYQAGLRSFVNEARILAQFDHPALIKVYRFWEANGTAYMVMPYYQGQTLKQALLAGAAPPDEAWLKALLAPLLDTLSLIHDQQCFHRDIAPDNILMLGDCHPLLLDFGAARRAIGGMEQAFTVILKQSYAPIEQYGDMPGMRQGAWTDLFALASVIHFAIDGQPPLPAIGRVLTDPYVPLAARHAQRYSAGFLAAIDRALSVRPEDRPQTAADMRALLGLPAAAPLSLHAPAPLSASALPAAAPRIAPSLAPGVSASEAPAAVVAAMAAVAATAPRRRLLAGASIAAGVLAAATLGLFLIKPATLAPAPSLSRADTPFDPIGAQKRILDGASLERVVSALAEKATIKIGHDRLRFSVRASHAGYLYVQMVGTDRR